MDKYRFNELKKEKENENTKQKINFLKDIDIELEFKLGKITYPILDILELKPGSLLNLDKEFLDIAIEIDGNTIGKGEIVIVNDKIHIKVKEITKK